MSGDCRVCPPVFGTCINTKHRPLGRVSAPEPKRFREGSILDFQVGLEWASTGMGGEESEHGRPRGRARAVRPGRPPAQRVHPNPPFALAALQITGTTAAHQQAKGGGRRGLIMLTSGPCFPPHGRKLPSSERRPDYHVKTRTRGDRRPTRAPYTRRTQYRNAIPACRECRQHPMGTKHRSYRQARYPVTHGPGSKPVRRTGRCSRRRYAIGGCNLIRSGQSSAAVDGLSVTPRISLVTPCLNQAELVRQTLASVLDQHYPNLEYVVMDGGSTDGSADVIAATESRLSHWVSEPDDGHYDAVNKGFAKTTGEVMGYLNGDDLLFPNSLFVVADIFTRFPEVQWLTGAHLAVDTHGRYMGYVHPMRWTRWHLLSTQVRRFLPQESTFWRRTLWEEAGGKLDHHFALAADFELWARFSRITNPYSTDAPIGCFRFVRGQRSVAFRSQYLAEVQSIRDRERALSKTDDRATRLASILLRASGRTFVRSRVDTMLGAHASIVFDGETHQFRLPPPSARARRAQRLFALLA
jgi:hypothetical protein